MPGLHRSRAVGFLQIGCDSFSLHPLPSNLAAHNRIPGVRLAPGTTPPNVPITHAYVVA